MEDYKKGLNEQQLEAVNTIYGPLLIIAGAGTGKTKTIVCRTANLIEHGILPQQIVMLTFTNKAAKEMKERVADMLGVEKATGVTACTFHSFCVLMLRRYGSRIGMDPNFTILASGDDEDIIKIVKDTDNQRFRGKGFPNATQITKYISASVNKSKTIVEIMKGTKHESYADDVADIAVKAAEYKTANNMMNYDDLLVKMNQLLSEHSDTTKYIAHLYPFIMVDEYQDTNPLQESILKYLFEYTKNIAVVGDDMQSLYSFRGAEIENILQFAERFEGCKKVFLTQNYRSNQEILDLSNQVVSNATEGFKKDLSGTHSSGRKPLIKDVYDQSEEAEEAYDIIVDSLRRGIPQNEICVLFRNAALSAHLELLLNINGIRYVKYGGIKFFDLSYVKDVLAYLRVILNPQDEIAWFRILQIHYGIGEKIGKKIASGCKREGIKHLISKQYSRRKYADELNRLNKHLEACEHLPLERLVRKCINFYIDTVRQNIKTMDTDEDTRSILFGEAKQHFEDLEKLIEIAKDYKSASEFLDDLTLDNSKKRMDEDDDGCIVLSTIHSAKGLEFDTVIILDCIDGIFPSTEIWQSGTKEDNEELRCFYVAVTRAKEHLYLFVPRNAYRYGRQIYGSLAHYLDNGENLYDTCN